MTTLTGSVCFLGGTAAFTGTRTLCGAVSSAARGSLCDLCTRLNVTDFFLSMNFFLAFFALG